ncbi:DUF4352 domain-containing protein [Nocardia sp. NPDC024068]|uniref:DUF4352 domain-containing protein n=1 Tax=Nocardia sp. NPDC024068 TaxID=3157197 RepID=UPI00340F7B68
MTCINSPYQRRGVAAAPAAPSEIYLNDDVYTDINPGNEFSAILAFDVPAGTRAAALEFHDSMFSGGIRVAVR